MSKSNQIIDLLIGGEAGQGLVTVGLLLSKAIASTGYEVLATQTYLSRIRGGHNTYQIRVGDTSPRSAGEEIDLLIALDGDSIPLHSYQLKNGGLIIGDEGLFSSPMSNGVAVPFREMGPSRTMNVAALGVAASIMGLSLEIVEQQVKTAFTKAGQKVLDENLSALRASYDWSRNRSIPFSNPITPREKAPRMLMTGNEAIGMGALAAGLKFCAFYPMTPSTSIVMTVIKYSQSLGCVVEQAEDEIAAVNMAIGASFCGAPAMVATSGGGFALMTEGVSLAGMTETPLVIAVAQRPGPATGLPTRTEQADLNLVLYAGHGEFPRAVFTPTDVTECFHIARKSFEIAERYQTPVFILTDQLLADSLRTIPPLSAEKGAVGYAPADPSEIAEPYRRYFITQDGISPRLLPGQSPHLVRADSDEHDENGLINEDPANRILMNEKRLKKGLKMAQEVLPPHFYGGDDYDLLLVCWGSTRGAVEDCVDYLRLEGIKAASLSLCQVWPLPKKAIIRRLEQAEKIIFIEGNATGQLARLVRAETGLGNHCLITRYDGMPFTMEYILNALKELI